MAAADKGLVLYGAGSLREAMTEIAERFSAANGIAVRTEFGASGRMRERIEAGEDVDLFTSADIEHARKLVRDGRATVMAMFARNTLCLLAAARFGPVASENALDALLRDDVRVGVSPAKIDPLGDYTVELFEVANRLRPGAARRLRARRRARQSAGFAATAHRRLRARRPHRWQDRCRDRLLLGSRPLRPAERRYGVVDLAEDLQVGPQYGLAVLKGAKPGAMLLALTVLSPEGQAILAHNGFKPVGLPAPR